MLKQPFDVSKPQISHFMQNVDVQELKRLLKFIVNIINREEIVNALVSNGWELVIRYIARSCIKILRVDRKTR